MDLICLQGEEVRLGIYLSKCLPMFGTLACFEDLSVYLTYICNRILPVFVCVYLLQGKCLQCSALFNTGFTWTC